MKLNVSQEQLIEAVKIAEKASGKNLTLPALNCVLLSASKNQISIKATNLDLGININIPAKINEDGVVAVPGHILLNTISSLYEGKTINLSISGGNLVVKTPNGTTTIKAVPHEDFPTIPHPEGAKNFHLPKEVLLTGLKSVWYSASLSSIKPELSSVYVYPHDKKIYFVATDSFRLAEKAVPVKGLVPDFDHILIPFRNIVEIIRVLEFAEGDVLVSIAQNQISFSYGSTYLVSRLIDGSFPDYKQIISKEVTTEAVVLRQGFINVLKKTTIFSDSFNQIRFKIEPEKKMFVISSHNNDVGETIDNLNAALTGDSLEISFNHKYIIDCFQSLNADSVSLSFGGLSRPMVIRGVADNSFLYLVMPMNK